MIQSTPMEVLQATSIYGPDVFRRYNGATHHGATIDLTLWDTILLTLEGYHQSDLQPHADALQADLLRLKTISAFVPKPNEQLSKKRIQERIKVFQTSIEIVLGVGTPRHTDQPRLFSPELKVGKAGETLLSTSCCNDFPDVLTGASVCGTLCVYTQGTVQLAGCMHMAPLAQVLLRSLVL